MVPTLAFVRELLKLSTCTFKINVSYNCEHLSIHQSGKKQTKTTTYEQTRTHK